MNSIRVNCIARTRFDQYLFSRIFRKSAIPAAAVAILVSIFFSATVLSADEIKPTLKGVVAPHLAPAWDIDEWINDDPGNIDAHRGKVVVIDFFQLWCPGCNSFTGPLMQSWQRRFSEEIASGDLLLMKIHTVFEGHDYQTTRRLKKYLIERNITLPVGVDRHIGDEYLPETKKRYGTSGTPEVVFIDREGMIRFQKFGFFEPAAAERYLETLLGSADSQKRLKPVEICLASDLCG